MSKIKKSENQRSKSFVGVLLTSHTKISQSRSQISPKFKEILDASSQLVEDNTLKTQIFDMEDTSVIVLSTPLILQVMRKRRMNLRSPILFVF